LKNVFHKLEVFNLQTLDTKTFTAEDCQFGYRESIFKQQLKGQFLITKVFLKLRTPQYHSLNLNYGDIQKTLSERGIDKPTIKDVSDAVISIRQSKLPDPKVIGNAGSFFKNPEIPLPQFNDLKTKFPLIVGYPTANNTVKVAAGWLIENAGWKGKRFGNVGVHEKQALVLVNYGGGKGLEIKVLAKTIQESVLDKFGIQLTAEVNWI
jgi:UDP-N-acetylmuramate dehydrogenase